MVRGLDLLQVPAARQHGIGFVSCINADAADGHHPNVRFLPIADIALTRDTIPMTYWTYREWKQHTVEKIVDMALTAPAEDRADYLRVQIASAIAQAFRHGRSGGDEDDPVTP